MTVYLGVDLGTQGCRAIAARFDGTIASSSYESLRGQIKGLPHGWSEQNPNQWWPCVRKAIRDAMARVAEDVGAVSVDSTSGTLLAIDEKGNPLTNGLMYNDGRSVYESRLISKVCAHLEARLGYRVRPSFAIAKLLWLKRNMENTFRAAHKFVHAADFIAGRLTGEWAFTDHSNALKSCFDLIDYRWPDFFDDLGIPHEKMPEVVPPGKEIGWVVGRASKETGIPEGTAVVAGLTDGCASQIASGAAGVGDWETTLGTTLVIKGVTMDLLKDRQGRIYSHLHPERLWMPGGASNTGGECLTLRFPKADLEEMDRKAEEVLPTNLISYPLMRRGERFPFVSSNAEGFVLGKPRDDVELYASQLEGVAYLERMAYDLLCRLGGQVGEEIFTAGGGARSRIWLQVRANVLNKTIHRPRIPEAAMGTAILAASSIMGIPLGQMARKMVKTDLTIDPDKEFVSQYEDGYNGFLSEISGRFNIYTNV